MVINLLVFFSPATAITVAEPRFFLDDDGQKLDITNFTVSSRYYDFNATDQNYTQVLLVKSIDFVKINNGANVPNEIALLRLATPFKMTTWIGPICIDWDNRLLAQQLHKGNIGKIATSFLRIEGSVRRRTELDIAYYSREDCHSMMDEGDEPLVPLGTFCADQVTDKSLSSSCQNPGSGAGLAFESDGLWYLRGIFANCLLFSAASSPNITRTYLMFKDVGHYLGSIRDAYDAT